MKIKRLGIFALSFVMAFSFNVPMIAKADNPIVQTMYSTDPAPMVYNDTVYVYTGHDEDGASYYDMRNWHCYSSKDMANWTDQGEVASLATFSWAGSDAWAPQCIERNGKFYLYVPVRTKQGGNAIGVAVADNPAGPFRDAIGRPLCSGFGYIDPTVFIDTNGQAYLYWGNPDLHYALLNNDMISIKSGPVKVNTDANGFGWMNGKSSSYVEGPWFYKRNNLYYMLYAAGGIPENISYSTSNSPTGPWKYRGVIMKAQGKSFTNHSGIIDFKGHSYFFYHNGALTGGSGFARSVCVEEFKYGNDGSIPQLNMTNGPSPIATLNPYVKQEAETICFSNGVKTEKCGEGTLNVGFIENNDWIKVRNVDFGQGAKSLDVRVASPNGNGTIEVRVGNPGGQLVGSVRVPNTGAWQTYQTVSCDINGLSGVKDLFFVFKGNGSYLMNFNWWKFTPVNQADAVTTPVNPTTAPDNSGSTTTESTGDVLKVSTSVMPEGTYYIKNVHSNKYLTVDGNQAGANVTISSKNNSAAQKWTVKNTGEGTFTLTSGIGNYMLDVSNASAEDGANIQIYNNYSNGAQQFFILPTELEGQVVIRTRASNGARVLDVEGKKTADGTNVLQWMYKHQANQHFVFETMDGKMVVLSQQVIEKIEDESETPTTETPTTVAPTTVAPTTVAPTTVAPTTEVPTTEAPTTEVPTTVAPTTEAPTTEAPTTEAPTTEVPTTEAPTEEPTSAPVIEDPAPVVADGTYYIKSTHSNKYLTVDGGYAGANVSIKTFNGSKEQQWILTNTKVGTVTLKSATGNYTLVIADQSCTEGANVQIGNNAQELIVIPSIEDKNIFYLSPKQANGSIVIDVEGKKKVDGTNVLLWKIKGQSNQRFIFEKVGTN